MAAPALLCALVGQHPQAEPFITDIALTPDDKLVAVAFSSHQVPLYQVGSGRLDRVLSCPEHRSRIVDLEVSAEGNYMLGGNVSEAGYGPIWSLDSWKIISRIAVWYRPGISNPAGWVELADHGKYVVGRLSPRGPIILWEAKTGRVAARVSKQGGHSMGTRQDAAMLVYMDEAANSPKWWSLNGHGTSSPWFTQKPSPSESGFRFSRKGTMLASVEHRREGTVLRAWSPGRPPREVLARGMTSYDIEWAPDERTLYMVSREGVIAAFDMVAGSRKRYWSGHEGGPIRAVALTSDGKTLVSGGANQLCVWNAATGALLRTIVVKGRF